ncbi:lipoyl protein ligase domain-containing protein [Sorangium sp. So ce1024]|uniref:lipoyl protein ligase domain-containing protein n=1 Tax=Sorangium sp. So ce1024 TaxID=3133327 RepID=UPI003F01C4A6
MTAMPLRSLPPAHRPLADALALGPALLERARSSAAPWIAASLVEGPAVVLGAAQRAGRVVDLSACAARGAPVLRRATTGTAAFLGGRGVVWTLALPHVAALAPDATARTLLNRNVRGFLRGFARAGAPAHYFGREWISLQHRPAALLGVDAAQDGAVLLEVLAGHDAPPAIPAELAAPDERAVDRWRGKAPAALAEVVPARVSPEALAGAVIEAVALHAGLPLADGGEAPELALARFQPITAPDDPVPPGAGAVVLARVPIGWIEAAAAAAVDGAPARAWLGGDVLTARWLLDALGRGASPASLDASPASLDASPASLDASPASLDASPASLDASPASLDASPASLDASPASLDASPASLDAEAAPLDGARLDDLRALVQRALSAESAPER